MNRSYLKKVFWPNLFVGRLLQILEILEYSPQGHLLRGTSGSNLASASILNQNLFFEIASSEVFNFIYSNETYTARA